MVGEAPLVKWNKAAIKQLREARDYIAQDSVIQANKVARAIVAITRDLPNNPTRFPPDKRRVANDGTFRVFRKYHYQVAYRVYKGHVRILHIRHSSRLPIRY